MKTKNIAVLVVSTVASVSGIFTAPPAQAHRDCYKQSLGFPGSWTEICKPHFHAPDLGQQDSCLGGGSPDPSTGTCGNPDPTSSSSSSYNDRVFKIKVWNSMDVPFKYTFKGERYTTRPGYEREHSVKIDISDGSGYKNERVVWYMEGDDFSSYCSSAGAQNYKTYKIYWSKSKQEIRCQWVDSR